jgi:hypothetical protein
MVEIINAPIAILPTEPKLALYHHVIAFPLPLTLRPTGTGSHLSNRMVVLSTLLSNAPMRLLCPLEEHAYTVDI